MASSRQTLLTVLLAASASALRINSAPPLTRRAAATHATQLLLGGGVAAVAVNALPLPAFADSTGPPKALAQVRETSKALKELLDQKDAFIAGLDAGDGSGPQLPNAIPFTTFQTLEKTSDPEFMEAAIDYAEAFRGARDLVKLAKLTKQPVTISTKEKGKPREVGATMAYGDAPGSNLASAKEYGERALQEVLGASVALEAAVAAMK